MPRQLRKVIPNFPMHIIHRGNNKQFLFRNNIDKKEILFYIASGIKNTNCKLHSYVIMSNHFHLLLTPSSKEDLSKFMHFVALKYAQYFNKKYRRTGTVWEGRFKSCLVENEYYLFRLYKYIEENPVKAKIVKSMIDYKWSSYSHNGEAQIDSLITEHSLYKDLASTKLKRCLKYKSLIETFDGYTKTTY
ncbi:MAG: hypothetical protein HAW60_06080 [Bdellovibrionales bacterium]|nr:hypothetical protein [Bdellovibrionales bacterium]